MLNKSKPIKLHLACGTVYLDGYINIDLPGDSTWHASERLDIVEQNKTDWAHYYKKDVNRDQFMSGKYHDKAVVVDVFADIRRLPVPDEFADEILAVQVFEHFTFAECDHLLKHWYKKLKPGGLLHLDVPDLAGTIELFKDDPYWATRLLYGSQKNEHSVHQSMYTYKSLREKLRIAGYTNPQEQSNIHTYPAFGVKAYKPKK